MKGIVIGSAINLLLLSVGLIYAYNIITENQTTGFIIYMIVSLVTPILGFLYNSFTQKKYDIITSTIYTSLITYLLAIIPIEVFKHSNTVVQAREIIISQQSNDSSNFTFSIDLSFNLANHITTIFIWILIATVTGFIVKKIRNSMIKKNSII